MTGQRKLRKGSLTDFEVGIIRNLIGRGKSKYRNQDILGLINTTRRLDKLPEINGGRISEVRTNKPRYKEIKAASDKDTDKYIKRAQELANFTGIDTNPLSKEVLDELFKKQKGNKENLDITETDKLECKESFGKYWIKNCIKAIVAFANNKGGYIVFGVKDKTWELVGIDKEKFRNFDRKDVNQTIRNYLSCGIDFDTKTMDFNSKTVGIIYIYPAKIKPVMFIRQHKESGAAEGHIYYRYQGENRLIAPVELQQIIEERIRSLSKTILTKHISNILSNGIENSAVLNLDTGEVDGKAGSFVIDEKVLPQISFVKEGEFVEKSGAPALKLIGELKSSAKVVMTKEDLIKTYPYSWQEMTDEVKKQVAGVTNTKINKVIKDENLKQNKKYSAYNFCNNKHAEKYKKTKVLPSGTPSLYNDAAVHYIIKKVSNG